LEVAGIALAVQTRSRRKMLAETWPGSCVC